MNTCELPYTLSATLALAINDARHLDRTLYQPHHRFWHGFLDAYDNKCLVCLAGSVISRSLHVHHLVATWPGSYPDAIERKLQAINLCRGGDFIYAFGMFHNQCAPSDHETLLAMLPTPAFSDFIGWEQFDAHLVSLEAIISDLERIEQRALATLRQLAPTDAGSPLSA